MTGSVGTRTQFSSERSRLFVPRTAEERQMIREELARVLQSAQFQNSKRYPALLRYVVEQSLEGNIDLKERTLGIEVFGREATYDSNADPVVRVTAGEVRKRLAQYYHDLRENPACEIELPSGTYVPEFRRKVSRTRTKVLQPITSTEAATTQEQSVEEPSSNTAPAEVPSNQKNWFYVAISLGILLSFGIWYGVHSITARPVPLVERFWEPVLQSQGDAVLCIGDVETFEQQYPKIFHVFEPGASVINSQFASRNSLTSKASLIDVGVLLKAASILQKYGKGYRLISSYASNLSDLRQGPVVLIGAHNNRWTLRLTQDLRFYTLLDDTGGHILDRKNPSNKDWTLPMVAENRISHDYALIARLKDPTTGRPVIILAGLDLQGNTAAGELVSTPEYLASLLKSAPSNWSDMNLEAVIRTQVIEGKSGPPEVVAVQYW